MQASIYSSIHLLIPVVGETRNPHVSFSTLKFILESVAVEDS